MFLYYILQIIRAIIIFIKIFNISFFLNKFVLVLFFDNHLFNVSQYYIFMK